MQHHSEKQHDAAQEKPHLSACMIVRDEEEFLPGCLESIRDAVDEIVIVDTGSRDKTREIAKAAGARLFDFPWEDDFSKHRNQSLAQARGDWILQIDADERLATPPATLREIIRRADAGVGAIDVVIRDRTRTGRLQSLFTFPRLFRRRANPVYRNRVHNQLVVDGKHAKAEVFIDHYGYDLPPEKQRQKSLRTKTLLLQQLEEEPRNFFALLNLAYVEAALGNAHEVIRIATRLLSQLSPEKLASPLYWPLHHMLFRAYLQNGQEEEALQSLEVSVSVMPPAHLDLIHLQVQAAYVKRRWQEVLMQGNVYLHRHEKYLREPLRAAGENVQSLCKKHEVCLWMTIASLTIGNTRVAGEAFAQLETEGGYTEQDALQMLECMPYSGKDVTSHILRTVWQKFASPDFIIATMKKLPLEQIDARDAAFLREQVVPKIAGETSYSLGILLMKLDQYRDAAEVFVAHQDDPAHGEKALFFAAQCLLECEERDRCREILLQMQEKYPLNQEARILYESFFTPGEQHVEQVQAGRQEKECILLDAAAMSRKFWEQEKQESAILLIGRINEVLQPDTALSFQDLPDVPRILSELAATAAAGSMPALAAALKEFQRSVETAIERMPSSPGKGEN